jgi:succinyl-diaminopimelate desuccinylase
MRGGDSFELSVAKILFKELLMLRMYSDPGHGDDYAYDAADIAAARRDEMEAARLGLDAEVGRPFKKGRASVREILGEALDEIDALAEGLGCHGQLEPLREMVGGGPNPAGSLRSWLTGELRSPQLAPSGAIVVPQELLDEMLRRRRQLVAAEVPRILALTEIRERRSSFFSELENGILEMSRQQPAMPVRLSVEPATKILTTGSERTRDTVALAVELVKIPSVTNCPDERIDDVIACARFVAGWLRNAGLEVKLYESGKYPSLLTGFPGQLLAPITLSGHYDVVPPEPDDLQFQPRIDGDYLWGRGAADMKTVVASTMVWLRAVCAAGPPFPPINAMLIGNEENGEGEAWGTPHILADLAAKHGWSPEIMLVGERTGEEGNELYGMVCPESRGVARVNFVARGKKGHTGTGAVPVDLLDRLIELKTVLSSVFHRHLTMSSLDGWESAARFPFLNVGEAGVYNITAGEGQLGLEIRPIPADDMVAMRNEIEQLCRELAIEVEFEVMEAGVACPPDNPHLQNLVSSVEAVSGRPAVIGKKKPGSSARFAPGGNAVVWGQSGIGPHSNEERHFIPSIEPYLQVLDNFARRSMND